MNNDIYRTFVGCFNEIGELQVSDEEFAEKSVYNLATYYCDLLLCARVQRRLHSGK
ncbi:Group-specific protein [Bacillus cereus]|nr:Group-specific protein [Bacillus cereus]